jgi:RimJ/RimL family protein N-acetyltransferase
VLASHSRAIACYRACGFRQEGTRRQAGLHPRRLEDFIPMALLQPDYASAAWNTPASGPDPA